MPIEIIIELLTFGVVVATVLAVSRGVGSMSDVRRRLALGGGEATAAVSLFRRDKVENRFLQWVQASTHDPRDKGRLRRNLALAGFEQPSAPVWYVIGRFAVAIGAPGLFLLAAQLLAKPLSTDLLAFIALALCGVGLVVPSSFVKHRAAARRQQMEQEFPDALDLMVVCVEAGLGLDAAFIRVGQEIHESHPRASDEFHRVSIELRAGRGRSEALRSFAERCDVDTVKAFVALLIQTDSLGTSIGQTLRSYSIEMRAHRLLKAEEKAMRIPVLMTVPLVACILPVIIAALLLPPFLDLKRTLIPSMSGHHQKH